MSFSPESSIASLKRLGRSNDLLDRQPLPNGKDLTTEVSTFISKSSENGGLLAILGHPSAGKTTEFNRVARNLCNDPNIVGNIFPLYTEFQNSELTEESFDEHFIWKGIISGSIDINVHGCEVTDSVESFCKNARDAGLSPVIMVDTLDILMLHKVGTDSDIELAWSEFLQSAIANKAVLIWTCRPFEWKYFDKHIDEMYHKLVEHIELPLIVETNIKPFTSLDSLGIDISRAKGWDIEQAWSKWSIHLQTHMPIFADRWAESTNNAMALDDDLFQTLGKEFIEYTTSNLDDKHWWDFADRLPTEHLYLWLWKKIESRLSEAYGISIDLSGKFRDIIEESAKVKAMNANNNSSRVRLEIDDLNQVFRQKLGVNSSRINDFYKICKSRGLLSKNGIWVDFDHQLLFEEAVINSADEEEFEELKKFPSILLRSTPSIREFVINSDSIFIDSVMSLLGHWMGYSLSFHPACLSEQSNLPPEWDKWIQHRKDQNIFIAVPELEFNEETEKKIALNKYFAGDGKRALLVNGAPGTGKTYFCPMYLKKALSIQTHSKREIKWRYYTMNNHLADHFDSLVEEFKIKDPELKLDLDRSTGGAFSIGKLLRYLQPKITLDKKWNESYGIGLLSFSIFKNKIREYYASKEIAFSGVKCPPLSDAWILYNEVIHDPVTGDIIPELNVDLFKSRNEHQFRMNKREINTFIKFHREELRNQWWTYSFASYQCRSKYSALSPKEQKKFQIDILIVDEVQDINPPVMALLLQLMRPEFKTHSIMVAGDTVQTVNRSGFDWIKFSDYTVQSLSAFEHPNRGTLSEFGVFDESELSEHRTTLQWVWRNGERLIEFNNIMRKNYGSNFGISERYSKKFDYPDGKLRVSSKSKEKDDDSMITVIETKSVFEYNEIIERLSEVSKDLIGEDIAVISPFDVEEDWNDKFNFYVHDAESVKGLEFDSIVILMPYLIQSDEATSSLLRNIGDSKQKIEPQIQKWADSWNSNKKDKSWENFQNFNQLFLNIMKRMNVLFSRPEKRILMISPVEFGSGVQIYRQEDGLPEMISFGAPKMPYNQVKINTNRKISLAQSLSVSSSKSKSTNKMISDALAQASLNNDGTQVENERKVWDNLRVNLVSERNAPISAIAYAGGFDFEDNIDVFRLLRNDLERDIKLNPARGYRDRAENQVINAIMSGEYDQGVCYFKPETAYFILSNLESIMRTVMDESHKHPKLHNFMMRRLFGIDVSTIKGYNFEQFISNHVKSNKLSLNEFSRRIKLKENEDQSIPSYRYKIPVQTENHLDTILKHLLKRIKYDDLDNLGSGRNIPTVKEWVDERESIWGQILVHAESESFDKIVCDKQLEDFVYWMANEFSNGSVSGIKTNSRAAWRTDITRGTVKNSMYKAAWAILNQIIPKLHDNRDKFSKSDIIYLSVYDALNLKDKGAEVIYDVSGLRILHDILELSFRDNMAARRSQGESHDLVKEKYESYLNKSSISLAKHMGTLEKHWLNQYPNYSHASARGKSLFGGMIHFSYLLDNGFKDNLAKPSQKSIIRTINDALSKMFSKNAPRLNQNTDGQWIGRHLQHPIFRYLLARILEKFKSEDEMSFTAQTSDSIEKFLSRLLLIDFISITDESCNDSTKMSIKINSAIPQFEINDKDILTKQIINTYLNSKNSNTLFFKNYAGDLIYFLDSKIREKSNTRHSRFLNKEMWLAWEWMLKLLKEDNKEITVPTKRVSRKRPQVKAETKVSRFNQKWIDCKSKFGTFTHRHLRLNYDDKLDNIYKMIERDYFSIESKLSNPKMKAILLDDVALHPKEVSEYLQPLAHEVLRFTQLKIKKSNNAEWINPQRILYSYTKKATHKHPINYLDWEICYDLWKNLPGNDVKLSFSEILGEVADIMSNHLKSSNEELKSWDISFNQIVRNILNPPAGLLKDLNTNYEKQSFEQFINFMNNILAPEDLLSNLGLRILKPSVTKISIFSESKEYKSIKQQIVNRLIDYLFRLANASLHDYNGVPTPLKLKAGSVGLKSGKGIQILDSYNQIYKVEFIDDPTA